MSDLSYVPGVWFAAVRGGNVVLVPGSTDPTTVRALWESVAAGFGAVLETLDTATPGGILALPPFAVVLTEGERLRVVVRGDVRVLGGATIIDGSGVSTWTESVLDATAGAVIETGGAFDSRASALPIIDGVVAAASVRFGAATADPLPLGSEPFDRAVADPFVVRRPAVTPLSLVKPASPSLVKPVSPPSPSWAPAHPDALAPLPGRDADSGSPVPGVQREPAPVEAGLGEFAADQIEIVEPADLTRGYVEIDDDDRRASLTVVAVETDGEEEPDVGADLDDDFDEGSTGFTKMVSPWEAAPRRADPVPVPPSPASAPAPGTALDVEVSPAPPAPMPPPAPTPPAAPAAAASSAVVIDGYRGFARSASSSPAASAPPAAPPESNASDPDHDGFTRASPPRIPRVGASAVTSPDAPEETPRTFGRIDLSTGESLTIDGALIIGRQPHLSRVSGAVPTLITVASPSSEVSGNHLEVRVEGRLVLVTDVGSTNGTVLHRAGAEPERLTTRVPVPVIDGDAFDIGDGVRLTFREIR
ncbi:FHA domain-containing protein [Microbacteriaceae bacterium VKM Ac-2855]|nr:FHA domain-containing protein [Microbacteriaceae bacterium VKM Ac-2855]